MANIIPTILTSDLKKAQLQINSLGNLVELIQLDLMDGKFVEAVSINPEEVQQLTSAVSLEAHLMVADPASWLPYLSPELFKRVYMHIEALPEPETFILQAKDIGFEVGLAIKLETLLSAIENYAEMVDSVLFMSVEPGAQGRLFKPEVLEKIDNFLNQFPSHLIAIDGGVNEYNIQEVAKVGVENISVGSAIFANGQIENNLKKLKELIT